MAVDQAAAWKTVADTAFRGINHCVAGSYPSGSKIKRSFGEKTRHAVRSEANIAEHFRAMTETWTGKGGVVGAGDGFMPL